MKISGAIFDMDGTLTDSMFIWNDIGNRYLLANGITPKNNLWDDIKNLSMRQFTEYISKEYGIDKTGEEIFAGIDALVEPLYRNEVLAKDGVFLLLDRLQAKGVKMCVATATDIHLVKIVLEKLGLRKYFSAVFTCNEVGAGKETPVIYEKALEHLGTPKEETVVFEDALHAVITAKKAGFPVAGIYDQYADSQKDEIKAASDYFVQDYTIDYLQF